MQYAISYFLVDICIHFLLRWSGFAYLTQNRVSLSFGSEFLGIGFWVIRILFSNSFYNIIKTQNFILISECTKIKWRIILRPNQLSSSKLNLSLSIWCANAGFGLVRKFRNIISFASAPHSIGKKLSFTLLGLQSTFLRRSIYLYKIKFSRFFIVHWRKLVKLW